MSIKVKTLIDFHGVNLWVIEHDSIEYVPMKPLSDMAGVDWRTTKRTAIHEENAILYGSKLLSPPIFACQGGASPTPSGASDQVLCIRLDRAAMYLARINVRQMKSQGNVEAAERLLGLQVEWAQALHQYETHGVAMKRNKNDSRIQFVALMRARNLAQGVPERKAITELIHNLMNEMGYRPDLKNDPQLSFNPI